MPNSQRFYFWFTILGYFGRITKLQCLKSAIVMISTIVVNIFFIVCNKARYCAFRIHLGVIYYTWECNRQITKKSVGYKRYTGTTRLHLVARFSCAWNKNNSLIF